MTLTGDRGGDDMVGMGSRVDTAGPPVSPLGSPVRPEDFRRGRVMVCDCEKLAAAMCEEVDEVARSGNFSMKREDMKRRDKRSRG